MNQQQAHAKTIRLQSLRYGTVAQTPKRPLRSTWYERKNQEFIKHIITVLALFAVVYGIAII